MTVLVVDDMPDAREMYRGYFEFRGLRVLTAADGLEALTCIQDERPDVIVLDLAMPRMTGWDVIRNLKTQAKTASIPIVALSGQDARDSALVQGADSYLHKPCVPEDLLREILRVLREPKRRDQ
jgi:twitching motility two-component system response regulator PilH